MKKTTKMKRFLLFCLILMVLPVCPLYGQQPTKEPEAILSHLKTAINGALENIDKQLIKASKKIRQTGLTGKKTQQALADLCRAVPGAIDCSTVDQKGIMVTVMPQVYIKHEGADISGQEHMARLWKTGKRVFSNIFRSVEGIDAIDLENPLFSKGKKISGSVSILLKPEAFLASIIVPALKGLPNEAWLMQTDGRIVYDKDAKQIGMMLFEDPLYQPYESLLSAGKEIAANTKGKSFYEFLAVGRPAPVRKDIYWDTVGRHGMAWRLVVVDIVDPAKTEKPMPGSDRDSHGCIGSAGYSWCESKQKCLRIWEEPCPGDATKNNSAVGNDKDSHGCIGSAGYSWCEAKQKCLRIWEEPCPGDATKNNSAVGDDKDSHGCIGSAGYSWCEAKQKCLRIWEEPCPGDVTTDNLAVGDDTDSHGCIGSAGYSWCEAKQKCLRIWEEPCPGDSTTEGSCCDKLTGN